MHIRVDQRRAPVSETSLPTVAIEQNRAAKGPAGRLGRHPPSSVPVVTRPVLASLSSRLRVGAAGTGMERTGKCPLAPGRGAHRRDCHRRCSLAAQAAHASRNWGRSRPRGVPVTVPGPGLRHAGCSGASRMSPAAPGGPRLPLPAAPPSPASSWSVRVGGQPGAATGSAESRRKP